MKLGLWQITTLALMLALLGGCVRYQPRTLPTGPSLAPILRDAAGKPSEKLSLVQATATALQHNPAYQATLLNARISALSLHAAGLLPDPQLSANADHPSTPGFKQAWGIGIGEDLSWVMTRGARLDAARARRRASILHLAWMGWSLAQNTAVDFIDLWSAQRRIDLLQKQVRASKTRYDAYARALARKDVTLEGVATSLVMLSDAQAQLAQAQQQAAMTQARLNADMGLSFTAHYTLLAPSTPALPSRKTFDIAIRDLPATRPDLLALAFAAKAADADFRATILAQFPGLNVGIHRTSDTSRVQSSGLSITLNLPIFGHTQTQARIARATRDQVYAEYQAHLDAADSQARTIYRNLQQISSQRQQLAQQLPQLRLLARRADQAFATGNLNGTTWSVIQQNLIAREREQLRLTAILAKGQVALAALLGHALPGVPETSPTGVSSR